MNRIERMDTSMERDDIISQATSVLSEIMEGPKKCRADYDNAQAIARTISEHWAEVALTLKEWGSLWPKQDTPEHPVCVKMYPTMQEQHHTQELSLKAIAHAMREGRGVLRDG